MEFNNPKKYAAWLAELTEAQREDVDVLSRLDKQSEPRVDSRVLMNLKHRGLIQWSGERPRDPGRWVLTDAGRAALRGDK
jgi:hypothetical protein